MRFASLKRVFGHVLIWLLSHFFRFYFINMAAFARFWVFGNRDFLESTP